MFLIFTRHEILQYGLELCGFDATRQQRVGVEKNIERFKSHFGSHPEVYAQIWEDLQVNANPEPWVDAVRADLDAFLITLHFLRRYPTESEQAGLFKISEKTARKWCWNFVSKIQALKNDKVRPLFFIVAAILNATLLIFSTRLFGQNSGINNHTTIKMTMTKAQFSLYLLMGSIVESMSQNTQPIRKTQNSIRISFTQQQSTTSLEFPFLKMNSFGSMARSLPAPPTFLFSGMRASKI